MPNNPAHDQPHKKAGVPGAGQFDFKTHAPAALTLDGPAASGPQAHHQDRHELLLSQVNVRRSEIAKMVAEQDKLAMEALSSGIRRDFPTATELRVKQHYGQRGEHFRPTLSGVRDKDGNNLTEGNSSWDYKPSVEDAYPLSHSFHDIRPQFFEYENEFGYDEATAEIIVPLDRDYAEGVGLR
jgi:hypothetical protein